MQRLRDGHREGGAAWLRTELEAKNYTDLRRLCAMLGLPQRRDGRTLRKEQLLESIVDCFSSQEGWSQGMGVERCLTLRTSFWCSAFGIQAKPLTGTGASEHGGRFRDL